ncbi:CAAX prenyl protease 2 isoform X6 [Periplaneta americana]|uniref:CAAX prenyl protease 2 isoform X6 n=1 Tax=Periplaneta americana TaxID=6978 RepID=UPI0037E97FB8
MEGYRLKEYSCFTSAGACFILSVVYVASLYVWNSPHNRDHPSTIKKRFFSVFIMMFVSPLFLYYFSQEHILQKATLWQLLGLRLHGLLPAIVIPMFLTMVLFLGPLSMQGFSGLWKLYAAHFHHMVERMRNGLDFKRALMISCFQFSYTTLFGAYSAFLFAKTGHFVAPFAAHAFCNHMGFPDFAEILTYKDPQRIILISLFFIGLLGWCALLTPLTNPALYDNHLFWKNN